MKQKELLIEQLLFRFNPNNTKITVKYYYNPTTDVINFIVEEVEVQGNINLGYLVEKLGNI